MARRSGFISYSRTDERYATEVETDLASLGVDAWRDQKLSGGQAWWDTVLTSIQAADVFTVLISAESLESVPCSRELEYAAALGKQILPIRIDMSVEPRRTSPLLAALEWVDYRPGDKPSYMHLRDAVEHLPPSPPPPTPAPPPPPVPLSYTTNLMAIAHREVALTPDEQYSLFHQLEHGMRVPADREECLAILRILRGRRELLATVASDIDAILAETDARTSSGSASRVPADGAGTTTNDGTRTTPTRSARTTAGSRTTQSARTTAGPGARPDGTPTTGSTSTPAGPRAARSGPSSAERQHAPGVPGSGRRQGAPAGPGPAGPGPAEPPPGWRGGPPYALAQPVPPGGAPQAPPGKRRSLPVLVGVLAVIGGLTLVAAIVAALVDDDAPPGPSGDVTATVPFGPGDDPALDALLDACQGGDGAACDELFFAAGIDTDYETLGATCGGVLPADGGTCEQRLAPPPPGTDAALDALWTPCAGGDMASCDTLFLQAPVGSDYEFFGSTCGSRVEQTFGDCVTALG